MNVITLTGNQTADPSLEFSGSGVGIAKGTIAVRRDFKNKQTGEYETDFINWKALGGKAQVIAENVSKGDKWGLSGSLQISKYEKDGQTRYFTEVIVNSFDFPNKPRGNQQPQNSKSQPQNNDPFSGSGQSIDINSDDLPF